MTPEQEEFVRGHVERIRPLERARNLAWWLHATLGKEEHAQEVARLSAELERIHSNRSEYERLAAWVEEFRRRGEPSAREVAVLYLDFLGSQKTAEEIEEETRLEKEVESEFNNFRGKLRGEPVSDNRIEEILAKELDGALRREAWEASKEIGSRVAGRVLELVRLRNRVARRIGFPDHYALALAQEEMTPDQVTGMMDRLVELTEVPFREEKARLDAALADRFGIASEARQPWHYADPFFQRAPQVSGPSLDAFFEGADLVDLAVRTFDGVGLEVRDILARSDLFARAGKSQHAFSTHVDRETDDVRVLCNLEPSERWMSTLLHELGHASYDKHLGRELPFLMRQPAHTLTTEAIAMLFGRLSTDPEWLVRVAGIAEGVIGPAAREIRAFQRRSMLIFVRWAGVMVHFERRLYEAPEQDLTGLWWDLVHRYQGVRRPEGRTAPDWAAKLHLALAPVYYHNYVFGEMMASQVQRHLSTRGGLVGNAEAGRWLVEGLFRMGARKPWNETLRAITGEPLDPLHFVAQYVDVSP